MSVNTRDKFHSRIVCVARALPHSPFTIHNSQLFTKVFVTFNSPFLGSFFLLLLLVRALMCAKPLNNHKMKNYCIASAENENCYLLYIYRHQHWTMPVAQCSYRRHEDILSTIIVASSTERKKNTEKAHCTCSKFQPMIDLYWNRTQNIII